MADQPNDKWQTLMAMMSRLQAPTPAINVNISLDGLSSVLSSRKKKSEAVSTQDTNDVPDTSGYPRPFTS